MLQPIELRDLQRLAAGESPDFPAALLAFLVQPEPVRETPLPDGAITVADLNDRLRRGRAARGTQQRRTQANEAWKQFLAQTDPPLPPRFQLGDLLVEIYERGTEPGRRILLDVIATVPFRFGVWAGLKRIFKSSEARMDAEIFGALAARIDSAAANFKTDDVSVGTLVYLYRRAWRVLRHLGVAVPELYPQFAVQVLRHYDAATPFQRVWVANHVWAHLTKDYDGKFFHGMPTDLVKHRAFPEAWKRAPVGADALMLLLETCLADAPARFAIQGLKADFPDRLRNVTPAWLERLAYRPLESAHDFLVETLLGSPEFHQGKLRALGLHDAVLALLVSNSKKARAYAIEYARAHAQDMPKEQLAELLERRNTPADTKALAASMLEARPPRDLGFVFLGRLLASSETTKFAAKALTESFDRSEITEAFLIEMIYGAPQQHAFAKAYFAAKYRPKELPTTFWIKVLDDPRRVTNRGAVSYALTELGKYALSEIGTSWLIDALTRDETSTTVADWLSRAEALPGLDVEKVKGLVFNPKYRAVALHVLGNPKIVKPRDLTLPWLLALARRADPQLHEFAHRYLLQHMKPQDFVEGEAKGDPREAGITRLFAMATGAQQPEPIRLFAQSYLRSHHPTLSADQPEAKALQLVPELTREAYTPERIWQALFDDRDDVRRFALAITKAELRRWNYQTRIYELADATAKDVRSFAYDALLKAGDPTADPAYTLKPEELDPAEVFLLTESLKKATREVGVELINRHYDRLGGPERLAWLMQSADREVRVLAVRLLWDRHRPRALPPGWVPRAKQSFKVNEAQRFPDVETLRSFLRNVLFAVPPGRSAEARSGAVGRRISSGEAKCRLVEIVRDLGIEDAAFAQLVAPILLEFTGSIAKTEWQVCLAAFMRLRRAHPQLEFGVQGAIEPSEGALQG